MHDGCFTVYILPCWSALPMLFYLSAEAGCTFKNTCYYIVGIKIFIRLNYFSTFDILLNCEICFIAGPGAMLLICKYHRFLLFIIITIVIIICTAL